MCGIYGGSGKPGKKLNRQKLVDLGLFNLSRGTDSCGYYWNGNLKKGIGDVADFGKFLVKNGIHRGLLGNEVFIGHNRKSTVGSNSLDNAHPHVVGKYMQVHNGTLKNHWTLCDNHGVDYENIHVDSIALAQIIAKDGWGVLNEYVGAATLISHYTDDPNTIYLYHGASRDKHNGDILIERPLFVLDTSEGLYFSSIPESLEYINQNKKNSVNEVPCNKVYKITSGAIIGSVFDVDRVNNNINASNVSNVKYAKNIIELGNTTGGDTIAKDIQKKKVMLKSMEEMMRGNGSISQKQENCILVQETYPPEFHTQEVYYRGLRFFRKSGELLNGFYEISRKGNIKDSDQNIPEDEAKAGYEPYWFIRGVMINSKEEYDLILTQYPKLIIEVNDHFAVTISSVSRYPVALLPEEGARVSNIFRKYVFKNRQRYTGKFDVKFASRVYNIMGGLFHEAITSETEKPTHYINTAPHPVDGMVMPVRDGEELTRTLIFDMVHKWCNVVLRKDDIHKLPEPFLMFIDAMLLLMFKMESTLDIDPSDAEIERQTSYLLKECITKNKTVTEIFESEGYFELLTLKEIAETFEKYDTSDLRESANRYEVLSFEQHIMEDVTPYISVQPPAPAKTELAKTIEEYEDKELPFPIPARSIGTIPDVNISVDELTEQEREDAELELIKERQTMAAAMSIERAVEDYTTRG